MMGGMAVEWVIWTIRSETELAALLQMVFTRYYKRVSRLLASPNCMSAITLCTACSHRQCCGTI